MLLAVNKTNPSGLIVVGLGPRLPLHICSSALQGKHQAETLTKVMVTAVRFLGALLIATVAVAAVADEYFEGDGTAYTLGQVSSGNCNFMSAIPTASTHFVALNQEQWNTHGNCGRCIEVSCVDSKCTNTNETAIVQVLDRCPECEHGALDLSPTVYKQITGLDPNRLTMRWRFVDCPNPGNVKVCLKEGSNSHWIAVQPTNSLVGVKSVTVNGVTPTMLDGAYYYVTTASYADLSAVEVAITSVNGDVISGTYSLTPGKCTDTNSQFGINSTSQSPTIPATTAAPMATSAPPSTPALDPSEGSYEQDTTTGQNSQSDSPLQYNPKSPSVVTDALPPPASVSCAMIATPRSRRATPAKATPVVPTKVTPTKVKPVNVTKVTPTPVAVPTQFGDTTKCRMDGV